MYVYDERGLRVPQRGSSHIRSGSTPAVMDGAAEKQRHGAKFVSVCEWLVGSVCGVASVFLMTIYSLWRHLQG